MKCFRIQTVIAALIILILVVAGISSVISIKLKQIQITNEITSKQKYMFNFKELSNYEEYKQHVIKEYSDKKVVALTYDDGPGRYTLDLLKILKENNAKATFFILGSCVEGNEHVISETFMQGHEIATHGFSHKIMTKLSKEVLTQDIELSLNVIEPNITEKVSLIRAPYGITNTKVEEVVEDFNLTSVKWDLDSLDWKLRNTDKITKRVLKQVNDRDIILMHDIYKTSVEATEKIISELKNEFSFITVSELLILKMDDNMQSKK